MSWGSRFVRQDGKTTNTLYARIHGVTEVADFDGAVAGWYCYKPGRIAGLHPDRYYIVDPNLKRPAAYWSPGHWSCSGLRESYVEDAFANSKFAYLKIRPNPRIGVVLTYDTVVLHSPVPIKQVLVGGRPFTSIARIKDAQGKDTDDYRIGEVKSPADIVVFLDEPTDAITAKDFAVTRVVSADTQTEMFTPSFFTDQITVAPDKTGKLVLRSPVSVPLIPIRTQTHVGIKTPAGDAKQTGRLQITVTGALSGFEVNGVTRPVAFEPGKPQQINIPLAAGESALLSFYGSEGVTCAFQWRTTEQIKADEAAVATAPKALK
jgi:hypothetical protein